MLNELSKDHMSPEGIIGSTSGSVHGGYHTSMGAPSQVESSYGFMDADFDGFDAWHHQYHHNPFSNSVKYPASLGSRGRIPVRDNNII